MASVSLDYALVLAAILFAIGFAGLLTRRNLIVVLACIEIMLNAGGLAFVAAGARWGQADGQVMFLFVLAMAAAEVAVGLAIAHPLPPVAEEPRHRRRRRDEGLTMLGMLWLIPALPAAGFLLLVLLNRRLSRTAAAWIGAGSVGLSAIVALLVCGSFIVSPPAGDAYHQVLWTWMDVAGFAPTIGFYLDAVSVLWVLVITFVGFLIHLYSTEHMERRRGLHPLLHVPEPVRRLDARAGAGRQPAAPLPGLGGRGPLQLPAHLVLAEGPAERLQRPQGVHRHPRRGHGAHRRTVPALHAAAHAADPADARGGAGQLRARLGRGRRRRPAHPRRRGRQVGAGPAADLAPGRDGRPVAGQRAHPRRDHGHRRRLPHRAHQRAVHAGAGRPADRRHRRHRDAARGGLQRAGTARPQARPRLLHHQPDRLHVPGARRVRVEAACSTS